MSEKSAVYETSTIAEMTNGIILANYEKILQVQETYQSEAELEESMIKNLVLQGYEKYNGKTSNDLYKNLKIQIEKLNKVTFTDEGIAMKPDTVYDSHGVFSGTALPSEDKLFLFYTGNTRDENWIRNPYQCIATMDKEGKITKNDKPFINKVPDGYTDNFRDPKVFIKNGKYYESIR